MHTTAAALIVGPRRLQNELLALHISATLGRPAFAGAALGDLRKRAPGKNALILWDGGDREDMRILRDIRPQIVQGGARDIWALFNLPQSSDIERRALELGVRGFFYEQDGLELLMKGLHSILDGELWMSRKKMERCLLASGGEPVAGEDSGVLTARERDILRMLTTGANNDKIGELLSISSHTVKTHIYNIFKKIKVSNRLEAALWATQQGLADAETTHPIVR